MALAARRKRKYNVFHKLIDKIFFGGYEAADRESGRRAVARFSRGNTSVQLGRYMDSAKLEKMKADGDRAAKRLARRAKRAFG